MLAYKCIDCRKVTSDPKIEITDGYIASIVKIYCECGEYNQHIVSHPYKEKEWKSEAMKKLMSKKNGN